MISLNLTHILLFIFIILGCVHFSFKISKKLKLIDKPTERKIHFKATVLNGGIIFFLSTLIWLIVVFNLEILNLNKFVEEEYILSKNDTVVIFLLLTGSGLVGLLADFDRLKPLSRIFLQLIILAFFYFFLDSKFVLDKLISSILPDITINYGKVYFTILCIILLVHAFNLMDGINGLASSVSLIWCLFLMFRISFEFSYILLLLIMTSVTLIIFFIFNIKGKCFLGDSGNYIISSIISISSIFIYNSQINQISNINIEFFFLLFMLPGIDMARLFIQRIINNKNPLIADKDHLHHILYRYFKSHIKVCLVYVLFIICLQIILYYFETYSILILLGGILSYLLVIYHKKKIKL